MRTIPSLATSNFRLLILPVKRHPFWKGVMCMKKYYALPFFLASVIIIGFAAVAGSGSTNDLPAPPAIGTVIEDFKLPDIDGAERSLKSLTGKNGAVLIFISVQCPVSNGYNERMEKLAQDYKARGINVVGIN